MAFHDALIFDVDGTLWDAMPATAKGWTEGLNELGENQTVTAQDIKQVAGYSVEHCLEILFPGLLKKQPNLIAELDRAEIAAIKQFGGTFYPGVHKGIQQLSKHYPIFLLSNCQDWYLKLFLNFSELEPYLTGYDCHGMSGENKCTMLQAMQKKYNLAHPVYIGDIGNDQKQARDAGVEFVHAAYGFGNAIAPCEAFDSFSQITKYFLDLANL